MMKSVINLPSAFKKTTVCKQTLSKMTSQPIKRQLIYCLTQLQYFSHLKCARFEAVKIEQYYDGSLVKIRLLQMGAFEVSLQTFNTPYSQFDKRIAHTYICMNRIYSVTSTKEYLLEIALFSHIAVSATINKSQVGSKQMHHLNPLLLSKLHLLVQQGRTGVAARVQQYGVNRLCILDHVGDDALL